MQCAWYTTDTLYTHYHDHHWGRVETDSQRLFAKLCLDGQQAGLSWLTILKKEAGYRQLFYDFNAEKIVANISPDKQSDFKQDTRIIRNKLKIQSIVKNAHGFLKLQEAGWEFNQFIWHFSEGKQINNYHKTPESIPTETPLSQAMSKELKQWGFTFVGPTICYAFLQAVGIYNDHLISCPQHQQCFKEDYIVDISQICT